jgi:multidrug efflux system membrane fusion protein
MENGKTEQELASQAQTEPVVPTNGSASPTRRRRWTWVVVIVVLILSAIAVIRHFTNRGVAMAAAPVSMGPVPVTTATAKLGSMGIYLNAIGTVTSVYTATITPQVTGVITAVHYREGQYVRKGDALIDIDSRSYAAQLEQARGTLERDQNLLAQAQMDLERYQQAWSRNAIPRQQLDDQQKVVLQQKGTVRYDEGVVHYDEVQVGYCYITSPINGRVGLRLVDPGNLATANGTTALAVITQIQPITVVFTLAEDHLNEVLDQTRHGAKLPVEAWDRQMRTKLAIGQLTTVDNQIDTTTGTVKLRATFDNRDNALFPNQFVNTRLPVKTLQNQVVIPTSAVQHNGDAAFVYVIQNGQAKMTSVKPGAAEGGMIAVEGIQSGEIVANSNFEKLQNGSKIATNTAQLPSTAIEGTMP